MVSQTNTIIDTSKHRDSSELELSSVGRTLSAAKELVGNSADVGSRVVGQALAKVGGSIKGNKSKTLRDITQTLFGAGFGLSLFKNLLNIPKMLSDPATKEKQSPMLIKGANWLIGGSLAITLLRGVLGGAALSLPMFIAGLVGFIITYGLSTSYESKDSAFGKIASAFGLRDKLHDALDSLKIGNILG